MMSQIYAAMTESGDFAAYEQDLAELRRVQDELDNAKGSPYASDEEYVRKLSEVSDLRSRSLALRRQTNAMFDRYAGLIARRGA